MPLRVDDAVPVVTRDDRGGAPAGRLADAAIAVIARDGIDSLSVRRVAREAGVSGGAVQHHFPTRTDLVLAALGRTVERQGARARQAEHGRSGLDRLIAGLCALVPVDDDGRDEASTWLALSVAARAHPLVSGRHQESVARMRRWVAARIREAVEAGDVPRGVDPTAAAPMLEAALDGLLLQQTAGTGCGDAAARRQLEAMVRRLLAAPPSRPA